MPCHALPAAMQRPAITTWSAPRTSAWTGGTAAAAGESAGAQLCSARSRAPARCPLGCRLLCTNPHCSCLCLYRSLEVEKRGGAGKGNWGVVTDTAE